MTSARPHNGTPSSKRKSQAGSPPWSAISARGNIALATVSRLPTSPAAWRSAISTMCCRISNGAARIPHCGRMRNDWVSASRSRPRCRWRRSTSLRLDPRRLDHLAPLLVILADDLCEFGGRGADDVDADGGHALLVTCCGDDLAHLAVERIDDVGRRAGRRHQANARSHLEAGKA